MVDANPAGLPVCFRLSGYGLGNAIIFQSKFPPDGVKKMQSEAIFRLFFGIFILSFLCVRVYFHIIAKTFQERRISAKEGKWIPFLRLFTGIPGASVLLLWLIVPDFVAWSRISLSLWLRWLGVGLAPFVVWMLWRVHAALNKNFSPTLHLNADHRLVCEGPYRHVRHPMYTVLLLTGCVVFLISANGFVGLFTIPGMILMVLFRLPREEAMMVAKFGKKYKTYMRQTGLLVPRFLK
jgi:protein-S-isoprenylcysteine O-methyltransferase Ste14